MQASCTSTAATWEAHTGSGQGGVTLEGKSREIEMGVTLKVLTHHHHQQQQVMITDNYQHQQHKIRGRRGFMYLIVGNSQGIWNMQPKEAILED